MKHLLIVGNWKSNKTKQDVHTWLVEFGNAFSEWTVPAEKTVVVCPAFPYLSQVQYQLQIDYSFPVKIGAQNISPFPAGAYTGEVSGEQLQDTCAYVLIGHSERREHFGDTDAVLEEKVKQALRVGLMPIFCVQGKDTSIPAGVTIVAYEPVFAIGSGTPDTPENANAVANAIKDSHPGITVIYGGSVTAENVHSFTSQAALDGVLPGKASLAAAQFAALIQHA